jgi:serine/threonine protein kinase
MSKECRPERLLYSKKRPGRHDINKVGSGKYGQVFVGCVTKACKKQRIAVKKSKDDMVHEFKLMKKAYKLSPMSIPEPYNYVECEYGSIIYYEFIKSKTLEKYGRISKCMLYSLLKTIYKLNKGGIRHNDIHLQNILIEEGTRDPYITDFGLSNSERMNLSLNYGISPKSDLRYDYHYMLNMIYHDLRYPDPSVISFIKRMIPKKYLCEKSEKVSHFRLRHNVDYPGLPSLRRVILDPYFNSCR